jgi:hypothetical protein
MKLYKNINNASQVNKGDFLVEFYLNSNEIWNSFEVYDVKDNGIQLYCKSGAVVFVSNDRLDSNDEYFKRVS